MADTSYTFVLPDRATVTPEGAGGVAMELLPPDTPALWKVYQP